MLVLHLPAGIFCAVRARLEIAVVVAQRIPLALERAVHRAGSARRGLRLLLGVAASGRARVPRDEFAPREHAGGVRGRALFFPRGKRLAQTARRHRDFGWHRPDVAGVNENALTWPAGLRWEPLVFLPDRLPTV